MSNKRKGGIGDLMAKKSKLDEQTAAPKEANQNKHSKHNPFLSKPIQPEKALQIFLTQARNSARKYLPKQTTKLPITKPFCEIKARIGILKVNNRRVTSGGGQKDWKFHHSSL